MNGARSVDRATTSSGYKSPSRTFGIQSTKTPKSAHGPPPSGRTPGNSTKTPGKTGEKSRRNLTPSRNPNASTITSKTPGGDRFIPNRSASCYDLANYLITSRNDSQNSAANESVSCPVSPNRLEYQRMMSESLNGGVTGPAGDPENLNNTANNFRILAYQKGKAPAAPAGYTNSNKVLYSARAAPATSCRKTLRHIPAQPDKILDAPEILDDYYLNLIDWSTDDIMAVALSGVVYLWHSKSGEIEQLLELDSATDLVTCVCFSSAGTYLAVGFTHGTVEVWDVRNMKRCRQLPGHNGKVGAMSWNGHILSCGASSGIIYNHDVRIANHLLNELAGHSQICGLKWSPDGKYLASGGNDNILQIWPVIPNECYPQTIPTYTLTDHQAAVKALAWCPWQPSILASGGGTADRHIRLWNISNGTLIKAIDTESQVCSLIWSQEHKELISGHGFPGHQLCIWKYPQMNKVIELVGHTARVLHMAMSPCGEYVVSAAADESLRIWHCFAVDPTKKKKDKQQAAKKIPSKASALAQLR